MAIGGLEDLFYNLYGFVVRTLKRTGLNEHLYLNEDTGICSEPL